MSDKTKNDAEPKELADEALKEVQGGRGLASATTVRKTIQPVLKPIGGAGETPPLDVTFNHDKVRN